MKKQLFVYGTLKTGCRNHHHLAGQTFLGAARTVPGFRLFDLGGYPGIAARAEDAGGVIGEVWEVDADCLRKLDRFEGVDDGLYRREPIPLQAPFEQRPADAYIAARNVAGCREIGSDWRE